MQAVQRSVAEGIKSPIYMRDSVCVLGLGGVCEHQLRNCTADFAIQLRIAINTQNSAAGIFFGSGQTCRIRDTVEIAKYGKQDVIYIP